MNKGISVRRNLNSEAAREWGNKVRGWTGRKGGWIYSPSQRPITQGWGAVWYGWRVAILDYMTAKITAFDTFQDMLNTSPNYRPTIMPRDWRHIFLADQYDAAQAKRKDPRRAFRGSAA